MVIHGIDRSEGDPIDGESTAGEKAVLGAWWARGLSVGVVGDICVPRAYEGLEAVVLETDGVGDDPALLTDRPVRLPGRTTRRWSLARCGPPPRTDRPTIRHPSTPYRPDRTR